MKFLFGFLWLIVSSIAWADGFNSKNETKKFADKFMDYMVAGQFQEGLNFAKPYWPIPEVEVDGIANQINMQWPLIDQRFG